MGFSLLAYFYKYRKADIYKLTIEQYLSDLANMPDIIKLMNGEKLPMTNKDLVEQARKLGLPTPKGQ